MSYNLFNNILLGLDNNKDYCSFEMTYNNSYYINFAINKEIKVKDNTKDIKDTIKVKKVKKIKNKTKKK